MQTIGRKGFGHFLKVAWEGVGKELPQLKRIGYIGHYYGRIRAALRTEQQPQHQHGDDRAYRAESYQAEAVFACMAVASTEATPTPSAIIKGTVIGPVVTPPESKAVERKSFGTNAASVNTAT